MYRFLIIAICSTLLVALQPNEEKLTTLFSVLRDGKTGFIDRTGKIVIDPQFDSVGDFSEGLAEITVTTETYPFSKHGYIDESGRLAINPQFDVAYPFSERLALVKIGDLHGFIAWLVMTRLE